MLPSYIALSYALMAFRVVKRVRIEFHNINISLDTTASYPPKTDLNLNTMRWYLYSYLAKHFTMNCGFLNNVPPIIGLVWDQSRYGKVTYPREIVMKTNFFIIVWKVLLN